MAAPTPATEATALWDFHGEGDELPLAKGDVVAVLQRFPDAWWSVRNEAGRTGLVPSNYLAVRQRGPQRSSDFLPPGWESTVDADSGERYYYNKLSGQVSYTLPTLSAAATAAAAAGSSGAAGQRRSPGDSAASGDLHEFKRLREQADAKLAALRQALVYQETLHLIDDAAPTGQHAQQLRKQPAGQPSKHSPRTASLSQRSQAPPDSPRTMHSTHSTHSTHPTHTNHTNHASHTSSSAAKGANAGLRLDPGSLQALARLVESKLEHRDDRLLGQVKALISHVAGAQGGASPEREGLGGMGGMGGRARGHVLHAAKQVGGRSVWGGSGHVCVGVFFVGVCIVFWG